MKRFSFRYESSVALDAPVTTHSWLLRALPREEQFQRVEWESLRVEAALPGGGTVIMGRKTLDSMPGGKALPKRRNIVLTANPDFTAENVEVVTPYLWTGLIEMTDA